MDNRNLILAVVISVAILFGFEMLYPKIPQIAGGQQGEQHTNAVVEGVPQPTATSGATAATPQAPAQTQNQSTPTRSIADLLGAAPRISITSPNVTGSISLRGARFDDLILNGYNVTYKKNSPKIRLLVPRGAKNAYYAEYGWVGKKVKTPTENTLWRADRTVLSPGTPVTLSWDNGQGLIFKRTIALDKNFMFTVTQSVVNKSNSAVTLNPYGLISRWSTPKVAGLYILHEGPIGVFDGSLEELKYKTLRSDGEKKYTSTGGWLGFTGKYWLTALVPDPKEHFNARMMYSKSATIEKYQTDFVGNALVIAPGATVQRTSRFFAGAKRVALLDSYAKNLNIANFDLAVDFGMFYFLTKPIFYALHYIYGVVGNFGVAIMLLTISIKLLLFPLANKSYVAMSKMKKLQPEIKKLQERFKEDKPRLNQEMMALYKKEKANPAAGCLPIVVQIPIFFSLYKVLLVTIEMRQAPFIGWIHDLSVKDPTSVWTLFGLIPWDHMAYIPTALDIGAWPLVMGLTMWLQQRLNPQPTDPIQAKVFRYLPVVFTFLLSSFASGLVIYWAWNNTLSILQQWVIMRRMGVKVGD